MFAPIKIINKALHPTLLAAALVVACGVLFSPITSASSAIAQAARMGDLDLSRELINAAGEDVNLAEPDGTTPLLWAVYNSSHELVQLLLEAGADPNVSNNLDISPLLQASRYGSAEMIAALLASGATLSSTAPGLVESPFMAAARSGSVAAVDVLLEAGANPNETEPVQNQTALMWATAEGHLTMVEHLLNEGADPNMQARVSDLTKRSVNADYPSGGFGALHWAARNGDEAIIKLLIEQDADINITNGDQSTPMMLAIVNDRFDIANMLLELGADANDGSLYYATIMRDATTDWRAKDGTVFRADHSNEINALDLTQFLLDEGADPNKPFIGQMHNTSMCCDTKSNETPFYRAAKAADIAGIKMMLAHGADANWKPATETKKVGIDGEEQIVSRSTVMVAITGGKGVGVAGGPNDLRYGPPPFRESGERDPAEAVMLLLEAGADVNVPGPDGSSALHIAAKALHPKIIRALVANGADIDALNKDGETTLHQVENMEPPAPLPGFYFNAPLAQPVEIVALLKELGAADIPVPDTEADLAEENAQ
ncbi:MAG: ankyrin repeat domain-containing protein [Gammaproteobacteria bacterium]|nr:ankyrin repeat domain-containing protein [Gammaproteobacteria bacterium]